jgi:kinesin family protein 5
MAFLERNLEQLTLVQKQVKLWFTPIIRVLIAYYYIQLVDQNSTLKKEAGIAERKLLARNERIQNLEALLQDADRRLSVQNQKFEAQLAAVKERLDQARGKQRVFCRVQSRLTLVCTAQKAVNASPLTFGRIAKPLRGGGGALPGSMPMPLSGGGGASTANPLTRLQSEEGWVNLHLCIASC